MAKVTIHMDNKDVYQGTEDEAYDSIRAINTTKKDVILGHEIGAGAPCVKCGDACPGLDLHFWRKICRNCKCGPADHKIADPTNFETVRKIGRLFDDDRAARYNQKKVTIATQPSVTSPNVDATVENGDKPTNTTFDWIPQGATENIVSRYMEMIPKEAQPISGTHGAHIRNKQLHEQLPSHDQAPEFCDNLTQVEADKLKNFVQEYKDNALGVGQIQEVRPNEAPVLVQQMTDLMIEPPPPAEEQGLSTEHPGAPDKVEGPSTQVNQLAQKHPIGDNGTNECVSPAPGEQVTAEGDADVIEPGSPAPKWACSKCGGSMRGGDVAVFAERAGTNKCWHPACFRCHTCSELLVDLIYFWKDENVFCGRHYADQIRPRCAACDELIFAKEYTQAEDQNWHLKHFCCWECDTPLGGKRYVARDSHPYCLDCYQNTFAKTCSSCSKKIQADGQRLSHGDSHWHATNECFKCSGCQQSLIGKQFLPKSGYIFCSVTCKKKVLP
ncbi:testin-like isoform X2 [Anneissia japonica]|uniref:testin-like isoform X2 n=1 Tax=Anneissia japonica TaxID=1529436 RepID=UPI0014257036|nr:testin-like isoform X2 [Anneissia japonica]